MQTIITKYLSATNFKGSRIKARQSGGNITVLISYDYELSADDNHRFAAMTLAKKLDWGTVWVEGSLSNSENVYIHASPSSEFIGPR